MTSVHSASRVFSLPEYVAEQRRIRRNMIHLSQSEVSGTNSEDSDSDVGAADIYSESEADLDSDSNGSFLQASFPYSILKYIYISPNMICFLLY